MTDVLDEGEILLVDRLPIGAVKLRIVKVLSLLAPCLAKDLLPFGARINAHFERRNIYRSIADSHGHRTIGRNHAPCCTTGLIKKFLFVPRERIRTNAFEKRRSSPSTDLISLQPQ